MDITILLALQQFRESVGGFLAEFMNKMTFLGEINTVLVIMAVIYWAVDREFGTYLLMGWSGNRLVNGALKVSLCAYRPWIRDARIIPYGNSMVTATGYSFPSGHSINAATVYGGTALRKDMPAALRIVSGLTVLLVAFSRLFLGVHTPQDVLVGAAAGMLVMWLVSIMMRWVGDGPVRDSLVMLIGLALAAAVAVYAGVKPYPQDFDAQGNLLVDGAKMANDTFKGAGWCAAFLIGWFLERRFVFFSTEVSWKKKLTRTVYGVLGYYAVSLVAVPLLKGVIPEPAGTTVTCFLQMFYISFIFPWLITRFEEVEFESGAYTVERGLESAEETENTETAKTADIKVFTETAEETAEETTEGEQI